MSTARAAIQGPRVKHAASGLAAALVDAYRFALNGRGLSFSSPQIALVAAYVLVYGAGLLTVRPPIDSGTILAAIALGLIGVLIGTAIGWQRFGHVAERHGAGRPPRSLARPVALLGGLLVAAGIVALALYFIRIGEFPLFMASAEQGRVDAAELGGGPLRVAALLAIPGAWLLLGLAVRHSTAAMIGAWALVLIVAALWLLTANRAPAFMAVQVAVVVSLLVSGRTRLTRRSVLGLIVLALAIVLAAGAVGAARRASAPVLGPPVPPATTVAAKPPNYPGLMRITIAAYLRVPVQSLQYTLDAVPSRIGWQLGWTYLQPIATILPGKQTTFDADLKAALEQNFAGGGTVPGLLGESYANFGPLGWLIVPGAVAIFLAWLFALARRLDSPAAWTLYAWAIVHTANAMIGGLVVASIFPYMAVGALAAGLFLESRTASK